MTLLLPPATVHPSSYKQTQAILWVVFCFSWIIIVLRVYIVIYMYVHTYIYFWGHFVWLSWLSFLGWSLAICCWITNFGGYPWGRLIFLSRQSLTACSSKSRAGTLWDFCIYVDMLNYLIIVQVLFRPSYVEISWVVATLLYIEDTISQQTSWSSWS